MKKHVIKKGGLIMLIVYKMGYRNGLERLTTTIKRTNCVNQAICFFSLSFLIEKPFYNKLIPTL